jgi:hypothetical protein
MMAIGNSAQDLKAVRINSESHEDSSENRHDVRLRPWINDVVTALIISQFWYFYGWLAGVISLLIGIGVRRRRIVNLGRRVHAVAWMCLCGLVVALAAIVIVKEYRAYQTRAFLRVVGEAGGRTVNNGRIQFSGQEIVDANLYAVRQFSDTEWLELHSTRVTDDGLAAIEAWTDLRWLFLNNNPLTDGSLDIIRRFEKLEWLELGGTQITDAGLTKLTELTKLRKLGLSCCTKVTQAGVQRLQKALPNCEIQWSAESWVEMPDPAR